MHFLKNIMQNSTTSSALLNTQILTTEHFLHIIYNTHSNSKRQAMQTLYKPVAGRSPCKHSVILLLSASVLISIASILSVSVFTSNELSTYQQQNKDDLIANIS